jgi:hypothetical protein
MNIYHTVSPDLLLGVSAGYCQRALVGESSMIRTQIGKKQQISNNRNVWDILCDTTSLTVTVTGGCSFHKQFVNMTS